MADLKKFAARMRYWCDEGNLGYDQSNRWDVREGGETDCSALVIHCLREAGFDTGDASYTGDMSDELCARGWERLPFDASSLRVGDIILNEERHVVAVTEGSGASCLVSYASIDENGNARGGQPGDQTDRETLTRTIYCPSYGWDCILRYTGAQSAAETATDNAFPLASGHWYGTPKSDDRNHSGFYWPDDRPGIKRIQSALGCDADGMFGERTEEAVRAYQVEHGLTADGEAGINTWTALFDG